MSVPTVVTTKIQNVVVHVIDILDREIGTIELVKLIYLIDVAFYRIFGNTLTGLQYFRYPKGPYTKDFANEIAELEAYEITREVKPSKGYSQFPKIAHRTGKKLRFQASLDPVEREVIDQVLTVAKDLTPLELEKLAYQTEPMQAIIKQEQKLKGQILFKEPIDFTLVKRDPYMEQLLKNRILEQSKTTEEYEEFLQQERKEFQNLLRA